jgi:metal-responsive CopG/Arc/MetJ family transcriptional regulator
VKTAVSIPNPLFNAAERLSKRLGISRSRLYAQAVESYLNSHGRKGVKEALDAVYGAEASKLDGALAAMQQAAISQEDW